MNFFVQVCSIYALACVCACSGEGAENGANGVGSRRSEMPQAGAVDVASAPADEPPARLLRLEGEVVRPRGPLEEGAALEHGDALIVREEGRAEIGLRQGGHVVLFAGAEAYVGGEGPSQIALLHGGLHAVAPPNAAGSRPPLRVATPTVSIELGGGGEFFVMVHPLAGAWIASLSGVTTVATGEVDTRRRLRVVELPSGRAMMIGTRLNEPVDGPTGLSDARAAALAVFEEIGGADSRARDLTEVARRLDESLLWLEAETRRGLELTTQHRDAVRMARAEDALRLERSLQGHAQQLHALRQIATARWERLEAGSFESGRATGLPNRLVSARRDRIESLLGI